MNSDVQTGVKSAGWLKRMTQLPAYCSGKLISPWVVTALNDGALSPMRGMLTWVFSIFYLLFFDLTVSPATQSSQTPKKRMVWPAMRCAE